MMIQRLIHLWFKCHKNPTLYWKISSEVKLNVPRLKEGFTDRGIFQKKHKPRN